MAGSKQKKEYRHPEAHRLNLGNIFRNLILGGQDGIVNVLGIVLGVATATGSSSIVLLAGLAATFAESISMGAVAYTSSKAEQEHYESELKRELYEIEHMPEVERKEVEDIFRAKGFSGKLLDDVVEKIVSDKKVWLDTMMRDELRLENPEEGMSPLRQAVFVGVSAIIGSFVPVTPYLFLPISQATPIALIASFLLLFLMGAYKSRMTSGKWLYGGLEVMIIGGAAAVAGYLVGVFFTV